MFNLANLRQIGFTLLDSLKGRPITKHIEDLEKLFADPIEMQRVSELRTRAILEHACKTTNFYREYYGAKRLSDFPVIQKRTVSEKYSDFLSLSYNKSSLVQVSTSGSYGTPFTFHITKEKRARQQAEIIFFNSWAGFELGTMHALLSNKTKKKLTLFLQNQIIANQRLYRHKVWLEKTRQMLLTNPIKIIVGWSSALSTLAEYCYSKGDRPESFSVRGIIYTADQMKDTSLQTIKKVFGCRVLSRYATLEFGVLAHQCEQGEKHHLNQASYAVEILRLNSDDLAKPGELGRVVVTDFFSQAMPLIRYDTGDLAIMADEGCSCGLEVLTLDSFEGRVKEQIYDTKGRKQGIIRVLKNLKEVYQFQFIQTGKTTYTVILCSAPSFQQEDWMRQRLLELLGEDAIISVQYVDDIPPLPSGKRPYQINQYYNQ